MSDSGDRSRRERSRCVGGGEWRDGTRDLDARLLEASGATEVLVLPTAAAYEHPDRVVERAGAHFAEARRDGPRRCPVLHRTEAESAEISEAVRDARFVYFADGSPLHLRSVLKGSALFDALLAAYRSGAVVAASGCRRHGAVRPDGRSPRRRVHRRARRRRRASRSSRTTAPRPTTSASARSTCCPRARSSSASTRRPRCVRRPGAKWSVAGAGAVTALHVLDGRDGTAPPERHRLRSSCRSCCDPGGAPTGDAAISSR